MLWKLNNQMLLPMNLPMKLKQEVVFLAQVFRNKSIYTQLSTQMHHTLMCFPCIYKYYTYLNIIITLDLSSKNICNKRLQKYFCDIVTHVFHFWINKFEYKYLRKKDIYIKFCRTHSELVLICEIWIKVEIEIRALIEMFSEQVVLVVLTH